MINYMQKIIAGVLLVLASMTMAQAQNTKAFFLHYKTTGQQLTVREDGANTAAAMAKRTKHNELAQLFYFKRLHDAEGNFTGSVWIASVKNPDVFLKRNGDEVAFAPYNEANADDYAWNIDYAGVRNSDKNNQNKRFLYMLTLPDNPQRALEVQSDGSLRVNGNISDLDNTTADNYRFLFLQKENVF